MGIMDTCKAVLATASLHADEFSFHIGGHGPTIDPKMTLTALSSRDTTPNVQLKEAVVYSCTAFVEGRKTLRLLLIMISKCWAMQTLSISITGS